MSVCSGLCHELAALARLSLTPDEAELFAGQLGGVVQYLEQLQSVDVGSVCEATLHQGPSQLRADTPGPTLSRARGLSQASSVRAGQVVVPKFKAD